MKKIKEKINTTKKVKEKNKKVNRKKEGLLKQIKNEMKKVHFPSRDEMVKYSIATIVFVIFFALYFYLIEVVMAFLKSLI